MKVDMMIHGIAGMAGLSPLLDTLKVGNKVAFANKESLVTAGHLVMELVKQYHTVLLPVDSEHSAIFQCLMGGTQWDSQIGIDCFRRSFFGTFR